MSDLPPYVQIDRDVLEAFIAERNELYAQANTPCPVCQGFNRATTDMVCMMCGRDYLDDRPVPGLGWLRLMKAWRELALKDQKNLTEAMAQAKSAEMLARELEADRNEWKERAEMVWRQRDAADRRAKQAEHGMKAITALLLSPPVGASDAEILAGARAYLRGLE